MALTLSTSMEMLKNCQESPIDLSRHGCAGASSVSVSLGHNSLLDRAMEAAKTRRYVQDCPEDLSVRPPARMATSGSRRHRRYSEELEEDGHRLAKSQRLEHTIGLLKVRDFGSELTDSPTSKEELQEASDEKTSLDEHQLPTALMQNLLAMQHKDATSLSYPPMVYLRYCALLQSLHLQQVLQQRRSMHSPMSGDAVATGDSCSEGSTDEASFSLPHNDESSLPHSPATGSTHEMPSEDNAARATGRRRAPRTLTGKHVRQGQGASPETLRTLKAVILERRRLKSLGLLPPRLSSSKAKKNSSKKTRK